MATNEFDVRLILVFYDCEKYNHVNFSVLHRYPPITPDPEEWETAMWELDEKISQKKREVEKLYFDIVDDACIHTYY